MIKKTIFHSIRLALPILAMAILIVAAVAWQRQSEKSRRMAMACIAESETNRQRSEGAFKELHEKYETAMKERDDLKSQLEAMQGDAGEKYCVPFSTEIFGQVADCWNRIYLLDKGRIDEAKTNLNMEMGGYIGILYTMVQTSKDEHVKAVAKENLVRIAKHRKEYPAVYSKDHPADPEVTKNVEIILARALKEYQ